MNTEQLHAEFEAWLQTHCDYDDLNKSEIELARDAWQAAIEADRKRRGEPIAWVKPDIVENQFINMRPRRVWWECNEGIGVAIYTAPQPAEPVDKSKNLQGSVVDKAEEMQGQPAEPVDVPVDKAGAVGHIFSLVRRLKNGEPVEDQLRQAIRGLAAEPRLDAPAQVGHTRFGEGVPWSTVIGAAQRYHAAQNTPAKEQERLQRAAENIKALHQADPVKLECPKCGAERSKVPCAGELMNCYFRGEAQSAEPSKQSEVREYLQQTLRTAADEACRLIANSDTPTKFEGIFGHRAEPVKGQTGKTVLQSNQSLNEQVKVPSYTELLNLWRLLSNPGGSGDEAISYGRALLARYRNSDIGQPAQQLDYASIFRML